MPSHEIDYEIFGDDVQIVEIELDPHETVVAEAGAMNYMEEGIEFTARMGDGSEPEQGVTGKLLGAGKRMLTGESIFLAPGRPRHATRARRGRLLKGRRIRARRFGQPVRRLSRESS